MKKKFDLKKLFYIGIIFSTCVIFLAPFFNPDIYISGHDTPFHISNITSVRDAIITGNFIFPKIYSVIANDFGYATGLFYGPLSHYGTAIISLFGGISVISAMKVVHFIAMFLSGLFMFNFMKKVTKNKMMSLVSAITYITTTYFIADIIVRDSYAECVAFIFLPLIFNGLYELLYNNNYKKFYLLFISGTSLLILTHIISTIYTALFVFIFLLFNYKKVFKWEIIKKLGLSLIVILCLTSFYTIPLIEQKLFANVNAFADDPGRAFNVNANALDFERYFPIIGHGTSDGIRFFLLIPTIILVLTGIIFIRQIKIENKYFFIISGILGFMALFAATSIFPWDKMPNVLLTIQFPWRLCMYSGFFFSIFSVFCLSMLKKENLNIISMLIIMFLIANSMIYFNAVRVTNINNINVDISTHGIGAIKDYFPVKTIKNYDYYLNRDYETQVLSGDGEVTILNRKVPFISFDAKVVERSIVEFPLFYYYGYVATCSNDPSTKFEVSESENGLVQVAIDKSCKGTLNFVGSNATKMSVYLSFFSILGFIIFLIKERKDEK